VKKADDKPAADAPKRPRRQRKVRARDEGA
jgi:hypothetical protein